jgi:DnaK suppressor protein
MLGVWSGLACTGYRRDNHARTTARPEDVATPRTGRVPSRVMEPSPAEPIADAVTEPATGSPTDPRAALQTERARLREELAATTQPPGQMTYGSQAAAASHVFEQQRDLALRDRAQQQLALVDAAIARLDAGRFGRCLRCGKQIAPERLEALSWAEHCIECARLIAQGRG